MEAEESEDEVPAFAALSAMRARNKEGPLEDLGTVMPADAAEAQPEAAEGHAAEAAVAAEAERAEGPDVAEEGGYTSDTFSSFVP